MKVNKLSRFLVGVALCVSLNIGVASAQLAESQVFLGSVQSMLLGKVDIAQSSFKKLLKLSPMHAPSLFYLSRIEFSKENLEDARRHIALAYKIDSTNTSYSSLYADVLSASGQYEEALVVAEKLLRDNPKKQEYYLLVLSLYAQQRDNEGIKRVGSEYESIFGLDEEIVEYVYNALLESKDYVGMLDYMRSVYIRFPENLGYVLMLANLTAALGEDVEALKLYSEALTLSPKSLPAQLALVNYYEVAGYVPEYIRALKAPFENLDMRLDSKIAIFEEKFFTPEPYRLSFTDIRGLITTLVMTYPKSVEVVLLYGRFLTYIGEIDSALAQYEMFLEGGEKNSNLYERTIEIYMYQKRYDEAIELAIQGKELFGDISFYNAEIVALWQLDDHRSAAKLAADAVKVFKTDSLRSTLYGLQGDIYNDNGDYSKSYKSYQKGLKYNPDNALILNNYGYFMGERGKNLDEALAMTTRANELSPDNATYLDSQAWVLYMMGRYVDAQLLMDRVMRLDSYPSGEVLMHYGDILYALGDDFLARNYWKKALEAGAPASEIEERVLQKKATRNNEAE